MSIPFSKFMSTFYYDDAYYDSYNIQFLNAPSGNYTIESDAVAKLVYNGYKGQTTPHVVLLTPVTSFTLPEIPQGYCILIQFTPAEDFSLPQGIDPYDNNQVDVTNGDGYWYCYYVLNDNGTTKYEVRIQDTEYPPYSDPTIR